MVSAGDIHVMGDKSADTLSHFFLTGFVFGGLHFGVLVLGFGLRKM